MQPEVLTHEGHIKCSASDLQETCEPIPQTALVLGDGCPTGCANIQHTRIECSKHTSTKVSVKDSIC